MKLNLLAVMVLLAWLSPARAADAPASAVGHRFLFLVDASTNLAQAQEVTLKTVNDLLLSGMNGEMRTGDEFAIWPFRDKVFKEAFPPESWVADLKEDHAANARQFVERMKFEGRANVGSAIAEVTKGISASQSLTVFLLTDGSDYINGTPFDLYVNTIFRDQGPTLRKEHRVFVVAFLGEERKIVDCLVSASGEKLQVPQISPQARSRTPAPAVAMTKPAPATPRPPPLIITKPKPEPVAETVPATVAIPKQVTPAVEPVPTAPAAAKPEATPASPAKPVVAMPPAVARTSEPEPAQAKPTQPTVAITPTTPPAATSTPPPLKAVATLVVTTPATNQPPATPAPASPATTTLNPAPPTPAAETSTPKSVPSSATVAPAPAGSNEVAAVKPIVPAALAGLATGTGPVFSRNMLLATGIGLIVAAAVIIWLIIRSARPAKGPSLISRSMER